MEVTHCSLIVKVLAGLTHLTWMLCHWHKYLFLSPNNKTVRIWEDIWIVYSRKNPFVSIRSLSLIRINVTKMKWVQSTGPYACFRHVCIRRLRFVADVYYKLN
jgi:hypothetical protein